TSACRAALGTSSPTSLIDPAFGSVRPRQQRSVVVLPAPLGPSRPKHSPRWIEKSRPFTTSLSPYDLRKPTTDNTTLSSAFIAAPAASIARRSPAAIAPGGHEKNVRSRET